MSQEVAKSLDRVTVAVQSQFLRTMLISLLCTFMQCGCARSHEGNVFVDNTGRKEQAQFHKVDSANHYNNVGFVHY
jgi:hypothetical protein